jgi:DNA-directed RNA polymerase specialized sigma24 family protein
MEAGKLADRIRAWLGELPARQREVVLLRDIEGMSSEEVCAVLALTEGTSGSCCTAAGAGSGSCSRTSSGRCDEAAAPP